LVAVSVDPPLSQRDIDLLNLKTAVDLVP
jgi:hypothetical protein